MDNKEINYNLAEDSGDNTITENADSNSDESSVHGEHHHSSHHSSHSSHHGHHHGHHRHHHGHHSSRRRSSNSKKKKIRIDAKVVWLLVVLILILITALVVEFKMMDSYNTPLDEQQNSENLSDILSVKVVNEDGVLVKKAVEKYLLSDLLNPENANVIPASFSNDFGRIDVQVPVSLKLSLKEGTIISYKVELADNVSFLNAKTDYVSGDFSSYEFKHLCSNTTYYYRLTVYTSRGTCISTGHFKTDDTPRILSIDGLTNVRDIGNWRTDSGKKIKQGLLIRGSEMDGAVESGYHLTNNGLFDMLNVFEIKTDMDLREELPLAMDSLGSRVEHKFYDMVTYEGIFTELGKDKIRMVFSDLADPDNYPIYLHCTYGRDRTGTVCYLLEALLGVSRGDCLKDYGLSNTVIAYIQVVEDRLKEYGGTTLKQQAENYLLSCGVSEYQIASIRKIFLGD